MDRTRLRSSLSRCVHSGPATISTVLLASLILLPGAESAWGQEPALSSNKAFYSGPPHNGGLFLLRGSWNSLNQFEKPTVAVVGNEFLALDQPVLYTGLEDRYCETCWQFYTEWHGVWFTSISTSGLCQSLLQRVEFTSEKPMNGMDVAFDSDSGYGLVVWSMGGRPENGGFYLNHDVYGYVLDASGNPVGNSFFIAGPAPEQDHELEPRVAATSGGHFVVTYRRFLGSDWEPWNEPGQQAVCARAVHIWYTTPTVSPELTIEIEGFQADVARLDDERVAVAYVYMDRITGKRGLKAIVLNHAPYPVAPPTTLVGEMGCNNWDTKNGPAVACNEAEHHAVVLYNADPNYLDMEIRVRGATVTPSSGQVVPDLDYPLHLQPVAPRRAQSSPAIA